MEEELKTLKDLVREVIDKDLCGRCGGMLLVLFSRRVPAS